MNPFVQILLILLLLLGNVAGYLSGSLPVQIASLALLIMFFSTRKFADKIMLLFFMFPFATIMKITAGQVSLFNLILLLIIVHFIVHYFFGRNTISIIDLSLIISIMILLLINVTDIENINYLFRVMLYLLLITALSSQSVYDTENEFNSGGLLVSSFSIGLIISVCFSLIFPGLYDLYYNLDYPMTILYGSGSVTRIQGLFGLPNDLAQACLISLAALAINIAHSTKTNKYFLTLFLVISFIGLLTLSKMFLFFFPLILLVLLFCILRIVRPQVTLKGIIIVVLVVIISITAVSIVGDVLASIVSSMKQSVDVVLYRIELSGLTTRRAPSFGEQMVFFFSSDFRALLFGFGLRSGLAYKELSGSVATIETVYTEALYIFGVIGFVVFFAYVGRILFVPSYFVAAKSGVGLSSFLPLVMLLLTSVSLPGLKNYPFYIYLLFVKLATLVPEKSSDVNGK